MYFDAHTHHQHLNFVSIFNAGMELPVNKALFSCGIHPWLVNNQSLDKEYLRSLLNSPTCLALGEIGLDKLEGPDFDVQLDVFKNQLELAEEIKLPVIIHCVKSINEILEAKKKLNPSSDWVFHGFNKPGLLNELIRSNMYVSIGPSILKNSSLQQIISKIPYELLLLETDNSECSISDIYVKVSELKAISLENLKSIVENNFKRVFKKWTIGSKELNF